MNLLRAVKQTPIFLTKASHNLLNPSILVPLQKSDITMNFAQALLLALASASVATGFAPAASKSDACDVLHFGFRALKEDR
jgi:hypothetical protein